MEQKRNKVNANLYNSEFSGEVNQEIEREFLSSLKNKFLLLIIKLWGRQKKQQIVEKELGIAFLISNNNAITISSI